MYRSAVHDSTSRSPAKFIFGAAVKLPGGLKFGAQPATERYETNTGKHEGLNKFHEFVPTRIKMVNARMKARYDRAANAEGFYDGQLVLFYNPKRDYLPNYIHY